MNGIEFNRIKFNGSKYKTSGSSKFTTDGGAIHLLPAENDDGYILGMENNIVDSGAWLGRFNRA